MELATSHIEIEGFSAPSVHGLVFKDDVCGFAQDIRTELLNYSRWVEMRQDGYVGRGVLNPQRQSGITTGHITELHRMHLPNSLKFREALESRIPELCRLMDVALAPGMQVEINGMAYGSGAWLAPHTDSGKTRGNDDRLIAWMLYLTSPEDDEWCEDKGGAVRLWNNKGAEVRLAPRFNRFAMFKVHKSSFHEIEKIKWQTGWANCRLALSGWIRGASKQLETKMPVYVRSEDYLTRRTQTETHLHGVLALYELMLQQRTHCGIDTSREQSLVENYRAEYVAHSDSPEGTSFSHLAPGHASCISVINDNQKICYFGPRERYQQSVALEPGGSSNGEVVSANVSVRF
jgi:hypothetical protein